MEAWAESQAVPASLLVLQLDWTPLWIPPASSWTPRHLLSSCWKHPELASSTQDKWTGSCPQGAQGTKFQGQAWHLGPSFCLSLVAQPVKNLPAMQETWARFLGQEDPLKKGMATHSSILGWRIPWTERGLAGYSLWGRNELDRAEGLTFPLLLLLRPSM